MVILNFKQVQRNPTVFNAVFLHQLCIHSVFNPRKQYSFAYTNIATLLKLAPRALDWIFTCLFATIF